MVVKALPDWMLCGTGWGDLEGGTKTPSEWLCEGLCGDAVVTVIMRYEMGLYG